ncbi:hypothetical protein [Acetobacter senegalensis]|nr:hypothetical protein [Acetobacter senegalensis]
MARTRTAPATSNATPGPATRERAGVDGRGGVAARSGLVAGAEKA